MSDRLFAVIPCAGAGVRAGADVPKQYRSVGGRAMLHYALAAFDACSEFAQTVLVLAPDDNHFDGRRFGPLRFAVRRCGGPSRHASVLGGLQALTEFGAQDSDWVLVHDAARPGITPTLIRALVEALRDDPVGGILALPVADTLKREQPPREKGALAAVQATESREGLWQAQTPQMFRLGMLRHALEDALAAGAEVTDEASAIERLGHAPKLVRGSLRNFKVTYPEDFALAEAFLGAARPA
ncbi:2-C-methyl-D-erythritol 4-phosphate cytidylyltransferase [Pandoraea nosoerga]|uniref:2-C-methyl-D-erythritol 4-phosphate cytidylyltransferase n=1 Tax=Pandoraea nosoerga TaxID=2508296 RepID=A0A5E4SCV0_9BURK|nr:2-C-methyl-D-erythritol 4-phosphate cytidylyltransferase [Pandoraea nosoerga]MBN4666949.1 2-C-methyl-D-erythritol 4-phosphate cytidylyltransferase [Pandoraea nosoerga]MBN4674836.1 2-C-methyl-D-erythritol 4-phosphate cytidylyltransferase [Pandoraea nosoerga]MBN4681815.1 2-C-methyl-D-erythritol 4-phosphate cytidylyltransferase [Pandoraea nosoerga]MBN4744131.1 2-C-methyl-D-erythritol 4-phosphate cytidylyltransferase [Pandoraea nosoerga]VVD72354.1 2-C-methyl-D-erythritol 4-phosphate cytidylyltr